MATSYYWITDLDTWGSATTDDDHSALCKLAEDWLTEHEGDELDIYCRPVRQGEAAGIYVERASGDLMILGHSSPVPDEVNDLTNRAWEAALKRLEEAPEKASGHSFACTDANDYQALTATTYDEAVEEATEYYQRGDWDRSHTHDVTILELNADKEIVNRRYIEVKVEAEWSAKDLSGPAIPLGATSLADARREIVENGDWTGPVAIFCGSRCVGTVGEDEY